MQIDGKTDKSGLTVALIGYAGLDQRPEPRAPARRAQRGRMSAHLHPAPKLIGRGLTSHWPSYAGDMLVVRKQNCFVGSMSHLTKKVSEVAALGGGVDRSPSD